MGWYHKVPENTKTEIVCATEVLSSVTKCEDTDMKKCKQVRSASRPAVSKLWPAGLLSALVNEVSLGHSLTYLFILVRDGFCAINSRVEELQQRPFAWTG